MTCDRPGFHLGAVSRAGMPVCIQTSTCSTFDDDEAFEETTFGWESAISREFKNKASVFLADLTGQLCFRIGYG